MKNYFSVLRWVCNMDYSPNDEGKNALVPVFDTLNQDFKIGERIIPNYGLLWELHTACVDWIHLENNAFNPGKNLDLRMEYVFDIYERVDNTTYLSWFLSNDPDLAIPDFLDDEGNLMESYKIYRDKYFGSIITEKTQENNMDFFFKELNVLARIEVVDIIYDFINDKKVYVLEMNRFIY